MGKTTQLCGASIIIFKDEKILLQQRKDNKCWGYPGGKIEVGEIVEDAAKREIYEETGLLVNSMNLFGVFSGPELHHIYPDGNEVDIIDIVYTSDDFYGELIAQEEEVDDLKWFHYNNIPIDLSPPIRTPLLKFIVQHYKNN